MVDSMKILMVVEGDRTEPRFFYQLARVYDINAKIYAVGTNIYALYKKMQKYDFNCNLKDALKEINTTKDSDKAILDETFTYTYLIYDCDPHHTEEYEKGVPIEKIVRKNLERILEMVAYFDNETDPTKGKLYVDYPMLESFRDCDAFFEESYAQRTVDIADIGKYKNLVAPRKLTRIHIDKYSRQNFDDLTRMNVFKLNQIMRGSWCAVPYEIYQAISAADEIAERESKAAKDEKKLFVLNTALFMVLDYYGNRDGFYDSVLQESAALAPAGTAADEVK